MSPQNPLQRSENETTLLAWQAEITRSVETPWLAQALAARVTDLLPRVARCHTQLRTLPRRTRRAWQRQLARSSDLTAILKDWLQRRAGRALQRQLARSVAGAALLLALAHGVGHAATISVTTNIPAINAADGKCSLIEAIDNANGTATHADCALESVGADTIVLPKAPHALSAVNNSTYYATGLPVITSCAHGSYAGRPIRGAYVKFSDAPSRTAGAPPVPPATLHTVHVAYAPTAGKTASCPARLRTRGRVTWIRRPPNVNSVAVRPQ